MKSRLNIRKLTVFTAVIINLLCLISGCKCGWPAIPLQSTKDGFVGAIRTDAQGREISRLDIRYKHRTWQFLVSPEGPVQDDYEIWRRLYEVTGEHHVRVPFQSTRGEDYGDRPQIFYYEYFPVGRECWAGIRYVEEDEHEKCSEVNVDMMVFTSKKIVSKFLIPALNKTNWDYPPRSWKLDEQNKQLLRIDTPKGLIVFDLQKGEFVTGKELVTQVDLKK